MPVRLGPRVSGEGVLAIANFCFAINEGKGLFRRDAESPSRTSVARERRVPRGPDTRVSNSSEIVRNCSVKSAALPKLRRANADAAAVAQFVNLVE